MGDVSRVGLCDDSIEGIVEGASELKLVAVGANDTLGDGLLVRDADSPSRIKTTNVSKVVISC